MPLELADDDRWIVDRDDHASIGGGSVRSTEVEDALHDRPGVAAAGYRGANPGARIDAVKPPEADT